MSTLIKNTHIISPEVEIENGAILIENGVIKAVFKAGDSLPDADTVYDAEGNYSFPGFIDIHAHGADTKDVCDNDVESIRHIAKKKLEEGVTTWLPTTLTQPQAKLLEIAGKCAEYMAKQEFAKTPGLHVEGPFINVSKAGAQNPEFVRKPNLDELLEIHEIAPARLFSIAPCVENACEVIAGAKAKGIHSSAAHTEATYAQVMDAKDAGLTHLTHYGNAMTGLHHREIGMVGAGLIDDDLKIELICDGIHLAPDFLKTIFKLKPIEQLIMITDSMAGSWIENGECQLGGLDVIVENNVARLKEGGALAGSALRYDQGVGLVADLIDLPLTEIVKATSWNQAQSLGLENHGKIEPGFTGDIAILDKSFHSVATFVDGEQRF
ncbi:N-acetylglucosamine-6-phosphate deacetylase [Rubritalea squalenifaciens DSM 18772]|uniref:N-acetylglucosamine-6-phosphate deacetylase n=1 Tax=Rubritalea squalenifaciens DSM 18772 TaxID=1123071 RepID=A0A1M6IVX5_9BACT|nr:N-acetylglucosamine-6-phosphate deacetylase [Rubritalea squalenifaciens]SHJ38499.1 N-acetylglucosamine-6-phosphate deacetylase [Rubritalea squalenifaciens DSM 18772]